jgi:hypothetical protein
MSSYVRNVLATSVVLAVACGGSSSNSNLGSDGGGTASDASVPPVMDGSMSGSGSSGGDDSGLSEADDSGYIIIPGGDDGGEDEGGASGGGSSSSSGAGSSGGMDGAVGVTTPPHGTDGGAFQIECGASPCDSQTQVCCASALGRMCTAIGTCEGDALKCSGTNSCASGVCCEFMAEGGRAIRTACEAACPAGVPQLCTTDTDCTKTGQVCRKYGSYGVCERAALTTRDP